MQSPWRSPSRRLPTLPSATACLLAFSLAGLAAWWSGEEAEGAWEGWGGLTAGGLYAGRLWQPLTHLFLPGGVSWLVLVEWPVLLLAGRHLEHIVGRRHVFALFLTAGATGGLVQTGLGWAHGAPDTAVAGPGAGVLAVFVALACAVPEADLVPPWSLSAGPWSGVSPLRIRHGALAAILAGAGVLGMAALALARGREPWAAGPGAGRMLAAGAVACVYMRQLGFGRRGGRSPEEEAAGAAWELAGAGDDGSEEPVFAAPLAAASGKLVVPRCTEVERRMSPQEYMSARVDPILDKISRHGIGSLTDEERRQLEIAREKITARRK